jgi:REP element-mobilizing transposase RayT
MPRKLRLEFPGACYHVINRGNYRADIFKTEGAKQESLKRVRLRKLILIVERNGAKWRACPASCALNSPERATM